MLGRLARPSLILSAFVILTVGVSSKSLAAGNPFAEDYHERLGTSLQSTTQEVHEAARATRIFIDNSAMSEPEKKAARFRVNEAWEILSSDARFGYEREIIRERSEAPYDPDGSYGGGVLDDSDLIDEALGTILGEDDDDEVKVEKRSGRLRDSEAQVGTVVDTQILLNEIFEEPPERGLTAALAQPHVAGYAKYLEYLSGADRERLVKYVRTPGEWHRLFCYSAKRPPNDRFEDEIALVARRHLKMYQEMDHKDPYQVQAIVQWLYHHGAFAGVTGHENMMELIRPQLLTPRDYLLYHQLGVLAPFPPGIHTATLNLFFEAHPQMSDVIDLIGQYKQIVESWDRSGTIRKDHLSMLSIADQDLELRLRAIDEGIMVSAEDHLRLLRKAGFVQYSSKYGKFLRTMMKEFFAKEWTPDERYNFVLTMNGSITMKSSLTRELKQQLLMTLVDYLKTAEEFRLVHLPWIVMQTQAMRDYLVRHHSAHQSWYRLPKLCHQAIAAAVLW